MHPKCSDAHALGTHEMGSWSMSFLVHLVPEQRLQPPTVTTITTRGKANWVCTEDLPVRTTLLCGLSVFSTVSQLLRRQPRLATLPSPSPPAPSPPLLVLPAAATLFHSSLLPVSINFSLLHARPLSILRELPLLPPVQLAQ